MAQFGQLTPQGFAVFTERGGALVYGVEFAADVPPADRRRLSLLLLNAPAMLTTLEGLQQDFRDVIAAGIAEKGGGAIGTVALDIDPAFTEILERQKRVDGVISRAKGGT